MILFARNYEIHAALEELSQFLELSRTTVVCLRCVYHHDHSPCKLLYSILQCISVQNMWDSILSTDVI